MLGRFAVDGLRTLVENVFVSYGIDEEHAKISAARMIDADLRGQSGHGILRLHPYSQRIEAGGYNLQPDVRVENETSVRALIDGDNGLGHVTVQRAVDLAITKAKEHGLSWVGTRRSNHAGAAGVYAAMALQHDLICLYLAVGNANHQPAWGGLDLLLSTNPIAIAIPAGEEPGMVLDIATTVVSHGRINVAVDRGETIPVGWLEDREGNPITDPAQVHEGLLMPIGGYKGYGLNLGIGALAGTLNGAAFGSEVINFSHDHVSPTNTGQAIMMIRPDLYGDVDRFKASMDERIREFKASTPMPGRGPVRIPGDGVPTRAARMLAEGIELTEASAGRLRELAERRDVDCSVLA
jgi:LDH2 family malate/lactate/ureidoglycolate dehydrogenase